MYGHSKQRGLATIGYLLYMVVPFIVGMATVQLTKTADSPTEQAMEQYIRMSTGQEIDFSAHLKKLDDGRIVATDAKAITTKLPQTYVVDPNVDTKLGTYYSK